MKMILALLIVSIWNTTPLFAEQVAAIKTGGAGDLGGGALTITEQGQLKTLAEAGVIFQRAAKIFEDQKDTEEVYDIPKATKSALLEIINKLPIKYDHKTRMYSHIINGREKFINNPTALDTESEKRIKSDYAQVIKNYKPDFDLSKIVIGAFSFKGKTYLLPEFTQGLNEKQQAFILIHEFVMRELTGLYPTKDSNNRTTYDMGRLLDFALQLDVQIFDLINTGLTDQLALNLNDSLLRINLVDTSSLNFSIFNMIANKLGRPLLLSDLVIKPDEAWFYPGLVQRFNKIQPGITSYVKKNSTNLKTENHFYLPLDSNKQTSLLHVWFNKKNMDNLYLKVIEMCAQSKERMEASPWGNRHDKILIFESSFEIFSTDCYDESASSKKEFSLNRLTIN